VGFYLVVLGRTTRLISPRFRSGGEGRGRRRGWRIGEIGGRGMEMRARPTRLGF
jgi:hypothetical protein